MIGFVTSFLGFLILPLIPLKSQIKEYQEARAEQAAGLTKGNLEETPGILADQGDMVPAKGGLPKASGG